MTRGLTDEQRREMEAAQEARYREWMAHNSKPTGRQIWCESYIASEGTFEDHAVDETEYTHEADFGIQSGTYWKTARLHNGMTVWRWGGMPPKERFIVARRQRCEHGASEREPCVKCQLEAERAWETSRRGGTLMTDIILKRWVVTVLEQETPSSALYIWAPDEDEALAKMREHFPEQTYPGENVRVEPYLVNAEQPSLAWPYEYHRRPAAAPHGQRH